MKTRKILFLLLALMIGVSARTQVTIGSADNPKAGAILDLNSTIKGGLMLTNVAIDNLSAIPASFPGVAGADANLIKGAMKGAMIYNTNPNTCPNVYVWNGDYWERMATNTIMATGTPLSSPNASNLFGGDAVEFTATYPGAKTYRWYASENNGAYEYLAVTTTPSYSKSFPSGNYKVKVIMDDCRSLIESNVVSFTPADLSPNFGSLAGGNYIYIYGNFPYAASGEYEQNGLVAHYDGIDNQGLGDKRHNSTATKWKDLKNTFELPRGAGLGQWLSNGFQALDDKFSFYSGSFPTAYPVGNSPRTVEVIFRTPDEENMFVQVTNKERIPFHYGSDGVSKSFNMNYRGAQNIACETENPNNLWIFYPIGGNMNNLISCLCSTPSLETPNTINTVTSTYQNHMNDPLTNSFINNTPALIIERTGALDTGTDEFLISFNLPYTTFLSMRLYNRVLTAEEIAHNAALDQKRYLTPPTVTIDGANCTEVIVLSPNFLMCKVPQGTATGNKEVEVNDVSYGQVYEYVDPSTDFYIHSILPIIGSASQTLTLTGNRLDEIIEMRAGDVPCTSLSANSTTATCILPANPPGETDITITTHSETYRFAKVFEYE
jgi:hypothetical protein